MVFTPNGQKGLRTSLEDTYQRRDLVHLAAGSRVPLLRQHIWLVTRGMVKLSCITEQGDDLVLGLAGPNEPFGEPLTNIDLDLLADWFDHYLADRIADCFSDHVADGIPDAISDGLPDAFSD
jgi:hypothetical protein